MSVCAFAGQVWEADSQRSGDFLDPVLTSLTGAMTSREVTVCALLILAASALAGAMR